MAKKKQMTEKDRIALERARLEFNAIKKAKRILQVRAEKKRMQANLLKDNGLE